MIKEIMLASALTLSHPLVNLELVAQPINIYFNDFNYPDLLINLDSGYILNGNIYYDSNEGYYVSQNLTDYGRTNFNYFIDYMQSGIIEMGFNYASDFTDCYITCTFEPVFIDIDFNLFGYDDSTEIYLSCCLLTNGEDDSTYVQVGDNFIWTISNSYSYFDIYNLDSSILNDNIYLNIDIVASELSNGDSLSSYKFNGFSGFLAYRSFNFADSIGDVNFDYLTFNDYIYNDFEDLMGNYETLELENKELLLENEQLNSKHVLSNVFDIVRGAFNGIVNFLEIEIIPNLTIGTIMFIPVVCGVIFFILKALVL